MGVGTKPLLALTANDLMSREVVLLPQEMSVRAAARLLANARISGAPVVDGDGGCIGVFSTSDVARWAAEKDRSLARSARSATMCVCSDWQSIVLERLPEDEVRGYMTPDPVTVRPSTGLSELARSMLNAHIHRVIVVDTLDHPVGIVSSTDILAALAQAGQRVGVTAKTQEVRR